MFVKMEKKQILSLSTHDRLGAGLYAVEVHKLLLSAGYDSRMYVKEKTQELESIVPYKRTFLHKVVDRLYRWIAPPKTIKTYPDYFFFGHLRGSRFPTFQTIKNQVGFKPDVVLVFWISDFITNKVIEKFHRRFGSKIIFIPPDAALFTGGCHYPNGCTNYNSGCAHCPAIEGNDELSKTIFTEKKSIVRKTSALILSGSSYLRNLAVSSRITSDQRIAELFGMVNEDEYKPISKEEAKRRLDLESDKIYILLAAAFLNQKRKGMAVAIEALNIVWSRWPNFEVILIGNNTKEFKTRYDGILHELGYVQTNKLNDLYNSAHFYLCPSLEDAGPIMVNQSMMAGTPVVGFDVGVLTDLVVNAETGYRYPIGDSGGLADGIERMLKTDPLKLEEMKSQCREIALQKYSKTATLNVLSGLLVKDSK